MNQQKFEFILGKNVPRQSIKVLLGCTLLVLASALHPILAYMADPMIQAALVITGSPLHMANMVFILLTFTGVLTAGALSDVYGRKKLLIIGASGLVLFSVIAFFFPVNPNQLILRAVGSLFSGLMIPLGITAVALAFDMKLRPQAFFLVFAASGVGILLRPVLEDMWVTLLGSEGAANLSTIILGAIGLYIIWRSMPESKAQAGAHKFGMMGIVLWSLAILFILFAVMTFLAGGSAETSMWSLLLGLAVFAVAWWWSARELKSWKERMTALKDQAFMQDPKMKQLAFAIIAGVVFFFAEGALIYQYYNYIYWIREVSALQLILAYLPLAVGALAMGVIAVRRLNNIPGYILLSFSLALGGLALLGLSILAPDTPAWWIAIMMAIFGGVLILVNMVRALIVLNSISENYYGSMSAINNVTGRLGYTFGMAASCFMLLTFSITNIQQQLSAAGVTPEMMATLKDTVQNSILVQNFIPSEDVIKTFPESVKVILSESMGQTFLIIGISQLITAVIVWFGLKPKGVTLPKLIQKRRLDRKNK
jgi:DHA2 family multidrug resistance protein-like MFS transporter